MWELIFIFWRISGACHLHVCIHSFFIHSFIHWTWHLSVVIKGHSGDRGVSRTLATNSSMCMSSTSLWAMGTPFVSVGSDSVRQRLENGVRARTLLTNGLASGPSPATHQLCDPGQLAQSSWATVPSPEFSWEFNSGISAKYLEQCLTWNKYQASFANITFF